MNKRLLFNQAFVSRKTPVNIQPTDVHFFKNEYSRLMPDVYLWELKNSTVTPEGVVLKNFQIFEPSIPFLGFFFKGFKKYKYILTRALLKKRIHIKEDKAVLIFDYLSLGYFHWILDALPRLLTVSEEKKVVVVIPDFYKSDFHTKTLGCFENISIVRFSKQEVIKAEQLLVPEHLGITGNYRKEILPELRNKILAKLLTDSPRFKERIYISRRKAKVRKILNEAEVIFLLEKFDFQILDFEDLKYEEQINASFYAKNIISQHGAGLTNMIFMQSGANVLEFRKEGDDHDLCYFSLADAMNLNYYYVFGTPLDKTLSVQEADIYVDLNVLKETVTSMVNK